MCIRDSFWVGYELPRGRHPKSEANYGGENGKTMEEMGYWQWAYLGKAGEKRDWDRCVHHTKAATGGATPGYYMKTCSGPFPGVCQLGAGGARPPPPPPLAPPSPPPPSWPPLPAVESAVVDVLEDVTEALESGNLTVVDDVASLVEEGATILNLSLIHI